MGTYNFRRDLERSKKSEEEAAETLIEHYKVEVLDFNDTNSHDILVRTPLNLAYRVEVKEDFMCESTGNVALEFESRGKPSGIDASQADFYFYIVHSKEGIYHVLHKTSKLKEMVAKKLYHRIVTGGDFGSKTKFYLFTIRDFLKYGIILKYPLDKTEKV